MTDDAVKELARRLVVSRKADGRCVYDPQAKAELVARCDQPGRSISRLARECGVNANQLNRWRREDHERRAKFVAAKQLPSSFVPVTIDAVAPKPAKAPLSLQARLPNGVIIDLRPGDAAQTQQLLEALGSLKCSASTSI